VAVTETYVPFPDAELVAMELHRLVLGAMPEYAGLRVVTFLPPNFTPPLVQVNRIGGAPDPSGITDYPLMRFAYYMPTRNESWQMASAGEAALMAYEHRNIPVTGVGDVLLDSLGIFVGGQMLPDLDPDDRRVVKDYVMGFRRQYQLLVP
jgi:hypothetical protein